MVHALIRRLWSWSAPDSAPSLTYDTSNVPTIAEHWDLQWALDQIDKKKPLRFGCLDATAFVTLLATLLGVDAQPAQLVDDDGSAPYTVSPRPHRRFAQAKVWNGAAYGHHFVSRRGNLVDDCTFQIARDGEPPAPVLSEDASAYTNRFRGAVAWAPARPAPLFTRGLVRDADGPVPQRRIAVSVVHRFLAFALDPPAVSWLTVVGRGTDTVRRSYHLSVSPKDDGWLCHVDLFDYGRGRLTRGTDWARRCAALYLGVPCPDLRRPFFVTGSVGGTRAAMAWDGRYLTLAREGGAKDSSSLLASALSDAVGAQFPALTPHTGAAVWCGALALLAGHGSLDGAPTPLPA